MNYPYENFYEMLSFSVSRKPAIFIGNYKLTYERLLKKVDTLARFLELSDIKKGDRVAIFMQNTKEFVISLFAITKIGAVAVPINTFLKEEEVAYILNDCDAKMLMASSQLKKVVEPLWEMTGIKRIVWEGDYESLDNKNIGFNEIFEILKSHEFVELPKIDDLAIIIYTSGTTGNPKGAMLSYRNIFHNCQAIGELTKFTRKDRFIVYLPMFHAFTLTVTVIMPLYYGASFVLIRNIMPFSNIIKQILLKRVTMFVGVPDVYNALSRAKLPWYFMWFQKVRYFVSGAAPLSEATINRFTSKFKRAKLLEGYGLSECSPVVSVNPPALQKPMSVGPAIPGVEIKIVDENMMELPTGEIGEIIVKGDNVMQGYLNNPTATDETIVNGWLLTGDMGYLDEEGFLFIVDRKKDLIISKGINIYPREIEEIINSFDGVGTSAVVGMPDEKSGEVPVAFIEPAEDADVDVKALRKFLKEKLANFKQPRDIRIVDELPKNATGKVLKRLLKEQLKEESSN
ncbi:fatty acid--CoA ligase [Hydrogenimonas thermophila]|uniref:fatty acid--CoA ligase n=1 Tax=Hydrogenimonas thermophila TaxID=223786 RepID=UPI002936F504|nr:fatty acid--CoA ligase [Hydrogenimonas thermophila]WOE70238.1 fatty acid--CoA ligase [Hydrogenimonas thermophila]WOE72755.1 fatty acid--CoA ligase [Hydrogenimonas thermophila]